MNSFDTLAKKVSEAMDTVGGYADRINDVAKLRFRLSRATRRANEAYENLGRNYYEHMRKIQGDSENNSDSTDFFNYKEEANNACREIEETSAEIARLDMLLREAELKNICPTCGITVGIKADRCRCCGTRIKR